VHSYTVIGFDIDNVCRLLYFNLKCNTIQLVPQSNTSSHLSLRPEAIGINEQILDATFAIEIVQIVRPLSSSDPP
jgi:hypothetical protein